MILIVIIAVLFYRAAGKRNLSPWLWTILGAGSYFVGQFMAGIILGLTNSAVLMGDDLQLIGVALIAGLIAITITYFIMEAVAKNKKQKKDVVDENLLDDRYLEK